MKKKSTVKMRSGIDAKFNPGTLRSLCRLNLLIFLLFSPDSFLNLHRLDAELVVGSHDAMLHVEVGIIAGVASCLYSDSIVVGLSGCQERFHLLA